MRSVFLFIFLFLVWCLICARWYVFSVKGLSTDPAHFNPHETTTAIVEVLFMVLVAFLLGFAIAWLLRETPLRQKTTLLHNLQSEYSVLVNLQREQKDQLARIESELDVARQDFLQMSRENEKLKTELEDCGRDKDDLQTDLTALRPKIQQSESELNLLRFRLRQLEQQATEKQEDYKNLLEQLEDCKAQRRYERKEPVFSDFISDQILPGVSASDADEKDDLKVISGIGPAIEKKLNSIGINSFKQISEFTAASSKRISDAIKFFPGRIERDRWVEQASRLYLEKLRK